MDLLIYCVPTDTITVPVTLGNTDTICVDTTQLPGTIVSIDNVCPSASGTNATVTLINGQPCIIATGINIGLDTACIVVCDDLGLCDTTIVIINVTQDTSNNPPIAVNDTVTTPMQTPITGNVVLNDNDPDGDGLVVDTIPVANPINGTVAIDTNGVFTYTPNTGFIGIDSFVYSVCDDGTPVLCDTAVVYIEVTGPSCDVVPDSLLVATTDCNAPVEVCLPVLLTSISNYQIVIDGQPYGGVTFGCDYDTTMVYFIGGVFSLGSGPYDVKWTVNGVQYQGTAPDLASAVDSMNVWDANGTWVLDGVTIAGGDFNSTYGDITFLNPNSGQSAIVGFNNQLIAYGSVIVVPNTANQLVMIDTVNGCVDTTDIDIVCLTSDTIAVSVQVGDSITVCVDTTELPGNIVSITNACNIDDATLTFDNNNWCVTVTGVTVGTDQACIVICDDNGLCDTSYLNINVLPAIPDTVFVTVPINDSTDLCLDPAGLPGNFVSITDLNCAPTTWGSITSITDSCATYTAGSTVGAYDTVCIVIADDQGNLDTTVFIIDVIMPNLPPVAINDLNNTLVDIPVSGNVITNDFDLDGDNITVDTSSVTSPSNGTVTIDSLGNYTYTPVAGFSGLDSFSYVICDDGTPSMCDTATVYITVIPITPNVNRPPVANNDANVTLENTPVIGTVLTNDFDPDGDNIVLATTPITPPSNGTIIISTNGGYQYTPNPGFIGNDTITYRICDTGTPSLCDTAIIVITVLPDHNGTDNNPPFAGDDANITNMDTPVSGNVLPNDNDPNGDNITINTTPIVPPVNGTVVIAPNGNYTYVPNPGYCGPDQFVYEICDDGTPSLCAQATVYITVQCINENTTIDTIPLTLMVNTSLDTCVDLSEIPGTIVNIQDLGCTTPTFGSATVQDSCMTYTAGSVPGAADTICVVVTDQYGNTDTTVYIVTVTDINPNATIDTVPVFLLVNTTDTFCVDLSDLTSAPNSITNLNCAPTQFGTATVTADSTCMIFTAGSVPGGLDTVCVVVTDMSGNSDTTVFLVTVLDITPDTIITTIYTDSTVTVCPDPSQLPGSIYSLTDLNCNGVDDGTYTDGAQCITYTAGSVAGVDTICTMICDEFGVCDTAIIIINILPHVDTIYSTVDAGTSVTDCVDTTEIPGNIVSVAICNQPSNGTIVVAQGANGQDTTCVTYTANAGFTGSDTACVIICDDQGFCDTTIIIYTIDINVNCDTVDFMPDFATLQADDCATPAEFCIPVDPVDLFGYDVYVDGVLQPSPLASCNNDTIIRYNLMSVPSSALTLDAWSVSGTTFGPINFNNFQEVVDSMNVWDPAGNWTLNGTMITGGANNPLAYGDLVFSNFMGNQTIVGRQLDVTPGGSLLNLNPGTHQVIITNPLTGCADTAVVTVECTTTEIIIDTIYVNDVVDYCPDDSELNGPIVSISNICPNSVDNGSITFTNTCFTYAAGSVAGIDTACIVICDALGNCDTTTYIITVVPRPDTVIVNLSLPQTDTFCLDVTELPGYLTSINTIGANPTNANIDIFFAPDSCVYITATSVGSDTVCVVFCDSQGFCDTTCYIINALEPPIAVNDSVEACDVVDIEVLLNDSIGGGIDTLYVLDEPFGGTYFVNFDNTINYTRVNVAPFVDSLTYVICNAAGCDTATVYIEIDCTEDVIVYTGFSPNGDNVNDVFTIEGIEDYPDNRVMVFNRWGNLVYQKDGYLNDWDGRWEGKDLPDGTYFYILEYTNPDTGETKKLSGYVQIHR
jgi:gliding motility-associated-like protein